MAHSNRNPEITVLKAAAGVAACGLSASAVVAVLMEAGVLRASPTRFAALALVALAFVNWLVRLLLELGTYRTVAEARASEAAALAADASHRLPLAERLRLGRRLRRPA